MSLPYAAGSIYSTVEDLYKWDQALHEGTIVSAESRKLMFTPGLSNYGYGLGIADRPLGKTEQKIKTIAHTGGINGFNSMLTRSVDARQTVIILDNVGFGNFHGRIADSIFAILNGLPADPPKQSFVEALYKIVIDKDVATAIAEYRKLKAANANYNFAETELNTLGYQLVGQKRLKDAIEIFKLNVEMYPASANVYDSLGEAFLADGQKELALINYKKALEINPTNNANAALIVKRLEGKEVKVDSSGFDKYVGEYQLNERMFLMITKEGDKLFAQIPGQDKHAMDPVSDTQFAIPAVNANVAFEKDASGAVTSLVLTQGTRTVKAPKIK
jgi:tetratricopeptide (TPR) repeat protein